METASSDSHYSCTYDYPYKSANLMHYENYFAQIIFVRLISLYSYICSIEE